MAAQMMTIFERIPDLFVEIYDAQFRRWARDYAKIGPRASIRFVKPLDPLVVSTDARRIVGCWLHADVDRSDPANVRVVIRPASEAVAEVIARHVHDMAPHVLH